MKELTTHNWNISSGVTPLGPRGKPDDSLTLEVIQQLRALAERLESGELVIQSIAFEAKERGKQKLTLEVAE